MNTIETKAAAKLKPIILACSAEPGDCARLPVMPDVFEKPDVAVSDSAREKGFFRAYAAHLRVFGPGDLKSLVLRINSYDLMIVCPLSFNSLAKFALGIRDSFPSELFWQFSQLGKPILLSDRALPAGDSLMNPHLIKTYRNHWETLTSGTISGFSETDLEARAAALIRARAAVSQTTISGSKTFITRDDIITAAQSLEPLKVPPGTIITDLAREEAQKLGVTILTG